MAWFSKDKKPLQAQDRRDVPSNVFDKCAGCGEILYSERLAQNLNVCPSCGHHFILTSKEYFDLLFDDARYELFDEKLVSVDPLEFVDKKSYRSRLNASMASTNMSDAVTARMAQLQRPQIILNGNMLYNHQELSKKYL